jgi:predicted HTH domain antitoxin
MRIPRLVCGYNRRGWRTTHKSRHEIRIAVYFIHCEESMSQIVIEVPDESLSALKLSPEDAGETLRLAAAVKLYELGKLSSGAAARLAGMPRTLFLTRLADYGVAALKHSREDSEGGIRFA